MPELFIYSNFFIMKNVLVLMTQLLGFCNIKTLFLKMNKDISCPLNEETKILHLYNVLK